MKRKVDVDLIGAINGFKLKSHVTGYIDDSSGSAELEFAYTEVPPAPDWHPLNYSDPLVLLPAYPGSRGAKGMAQLYPSGAFRADVTFDFDNGMVLRKGANINVDPKQGLHYGGYYMFGTARLGGMADKLGAGNGAKLAYSYSEYLHPAGPGHVIGVGHARWPGGKAGRPIEAVVGSRYRFADKKVLPGHFIRTVEIPDATWNARTKVVKATFKTRIEPL